MREQQARVSQTRIRQEGFIWRDTLSRTVMAGTCHARRSATRETALID
jgi:hypothetical protein